MQSQLQNRCSNFPAAINACNVTYRTAGAPRKLKTYPVKVALVTKLSSVIFYNFGEERNVEKKKPVEKKPVEKKPVEKKKPV
jgi:hypothetical protein